MQEKANVRKGKVEVSRHITIHYLTAIEVKTGSKTAVEPGKVRHTPAVTHRHEEGDEEVTHRDRCRTRYTGTEAHLTKMEDPKLLKYRRMIRQTGFHSGLKTAPLSHSQIDDQRTLLHLPYQVGRDAVVMALVDVLHGTDHHISRAKHIAQYVGLQRGGE